MPYVSDKQRRFFHTASARKAGITPEMVAEYDAASRGTKSAATNPSLPKPGAFNPPKPPSPPAIKLPELPKVDAHPSIKSLHSQTRDSGAASSLSSPETRLGGDGPTMPKAS